MRALETPPRGVKNPCGVTRLWRLVAIGGSKRMLSLGFGASEPPRPGSVVLEAFGSQDFQTEFSNMAEHGQTSTQTSGKGRLTVFMFATNGLLRAWTWTKV